MHRKPTRVYTPVHPRVHRGKGPYRQEPLLDSCNNVLSPKMTVNSISNLNFPAFGHVERQTPNQLYCVLDRDLLAPRVLPKPLVIRRWRFIGAQGQKTALFPGFLSPENKAVFEELFGNRLIPKVNHLEIRRVFDGETENRLISLVYHLINKEFFSEVLCENRLILEINHL